MPLLVIATDRTSDLVAPVADLKLELPAFAMVDHLLGIAHATYNKREAPFSRVLAIDDQWEAERNTRKSQCE